MSLFLRRVLCASALGIVIMLTPAYSGNVYYDADQATFNSLTGNMSVIDFSNQVAANNYKYTQSSDGYLVNPEVGNTSLQVRFVGVNPGYSGYYTNINNYPGGYSDWNTGAVLRGPTAWNGTSNIHIDLPTAVTAVSLNLMTWQYGASSGEAQGGNVTFSINGSPVDIVSTKVWSYSSDPPTPGTLYALPTWYGITSDTPINYIDLSTAGTLLIDNFSFGDLLSGPSGEDPPPQDPGADTPEATTLIMIGTGLLSMRYMKKRSGATPA